MGRQCGEGMEHAWSRLNLLGLDSHSRPACCAHLKPQTHSTPEIMTFSTLTLLGVSPTECLSAKVQIPDQILFLPSSPSPRLH